MTPRPTLFDLALRKAVKRAGQITHIRPVVVVSNDAPANEPCAEPRTFREIEAEANADARAIVRSGTLSEADLIAIDRAMLVTWNKSLPEREYAAICAQWKREGITCMPFGVPHPSQVEN